MASGAFAASGVLLLSQANHMSLVGIGIGAVTSTMQATVYASTVLLIRRNFHRHYALAHGMVISGYSCGLFVFPPILEALSITYSWRGTCFIASGIMFHTVLMGALTKSPRTREGDVETEVDDKASNRPVIDSQQDIRTRNGMSLDCNDPSGSADTGCNGDAQRNVEVEEGNVDRIDSDLQASTENNSEEHMISRSDLVKNNALSTPETRHVEMPEGGYKNNAFTAAEDPLDGNPQNNLNLDRPSAMHICNTERIMVSGVGSNQNSRCLQSAIARNYHTFVIYTLSMFSTTVGYSIFLVHVSTSFKEFGVDLKNIAAALSVFAAFNLIGRVSNGLFVSRGISPAHLIILAEILAFVSIMGMYLLQLFPLRATATALFGIGTGVSTTLFYVFHREIVDPKVDVKTLSIFIFVEGLAGPAGGALGGLLRDFAGGYRLAYFTSAGLSLFAAVLMIVAIVMERRRKKSSEVVMNVDV
ncbi:uncharacterized protein LOC121424263 [Lytechinus variegatus]|uniref:uncharacterized protein LOC121424263 n=1 Tax=Lytechinus variegatus TaxID=7654 RepID=UPI001BB13F10|nr:uncharacterized protein LOC121424263 [Lytechinus variegatus]